VTSEESESRRQLVRLKTVKRPEETFQMAPMIDMVFLLLVFFMCVSVLAQADKTIELALPESSEIQVADSFSNRGKISLDGEGKIFIFAQNLTLEEMQNKIKEAIKMNPELKVQIRADKETHYDKIKEVLKACAEVGAYEVIFSTYQSR
jgi:biopolymer transport protein ExbD